MPELVIRLSEQGSKGRIDNAKMKWLMADGEVEIRIGSSAISNGIRKEVHNIFAVVVLENRAALSNQGFHTSTFLLLVDHPFHNRLLRGISESQALKRIEYGNLIGCR